MNQEELKDCLKRLGNDQGGMDYLQKTTTDLEIILEAIQKPIPIEMVQQIAKSVIECRLPNQKLGSKILMQVVQVCLNSFEHLKAWETLRLVIDPDKQIYKSELLALDETQFSHHPIDQEFCESLKEGDCVDALYEEDRSNVIGWCRGIIVKANERFVWVRWDECDSKRKISRYCSDLAKAQSKVTQEEWEWRHSLKSGDVIDCYDNRQWSNATIIDIAGNDEYIVGFRQYDEKGTQFDSQNQRFYGWNQQYDERIKAISPRIQKKNTFSQNDDFIHDCNDFLYPEEDYAVPRFHGKSARRSQIICDMIKKLGEGGVFDYILESLNNKCSIDFTQAYWLLLSNFYDILHRNFVQKFVPKIYEYTKCNILQSSDNNLRNFSGQKINDILGALSNILKRVYSSNQRQEMIDKLDMDIAYKCFSSDFLERKIQGLKAIQELIKKTKDNYIDTPKYLTTQLMGEWLNEKKIFETLYVGQSNSHLVQRSAEFFKFLLEEKMIGLQQLEQIWNSLDKAEYEHKLAIYKLFKEISSSCDKEWLDYLTDSVCQKDVNNITKDDLELLSDIIKMNYRYREEYLQRCCNYYWRVLKNNQASNQLIDQYIQYYVEQVTSFEMRPHKSEQICLIGESILENIPIVIKVLIKLIDKLDIQPAAWDQYTRNAALVDLESKYNIVQKIIGSLETLKQQQTNIIDIEDIKIRMQFIQFFYQNITSYEYKLTFDVISQLWELLVCKSSCQQERDLVYKWFSILSNQDGQQQLTQLVTLENLKIFFNEKMSVDLVTLTEEGFNCFKTVLNAINKQEQSNFGLEVLWKIILNTQSQKVSQLAIEFHHQFNTTLEKIFEQLRLNKDDNQKLLRCLLVLEDYIDQSEINGVGNLKSLNALSRGEELHIPIYNEHSSQKKFTITINDNQTIIELRLAISKILKQQWDSIGLNCLKGEIKFTENGKMIKDLRLKKGETLLVFRKNIKDVQEAILIENDQLTEPAKVVFAEIFSEYSHDNKMSKEDCTRFVAGCTGNPCSIDDSNIQKTFEQYDKDKDGILTLDDFLEFYADSAKSKKQTVWLNLQTLHYRNDLIRGDRVPLPQINGQQLPRGQIVQNKYLDILFDLLSNIQDTTIQEKTWYLLRRLPPSPTVIKQMLTFDGIKSSDDWDIILKSSNYRLLYSLYIIEFLMSINDDENLKALIEDEELIQLKEKWMEKFLQFGGFDKLLLFFIEYQNKSIITLTLIEKEILSFLLKTFTQYLVAACASNIENLYRASNAIQENKSLDQVLNDIRNIQEPQEFKVLVDRLKLSRLGESIISKVENFLKVLLDLIQELLSSIELESEERQIIEYSMIMVIILILHNKQLLINTIQINDLIEILFKGILSNMESLRNLFSRTILVLCHESQKMNNYTPTKLILQKLIEMQNSQSSQYYDLLSQLIDSAFECGETLIDYQQLAEQVLDNLIQHKSNEIRLKNNNPDKVLIGLLNLLCKLHQHLKKPIVEKIIQECLFSFDEDNEIKCKSIESRQVAFKLVSLLAKQELNIVINNLQLITSKIPYINRWNYTPSNDIRSQLGYCGIRNLRCICYMNAMLQQFYMILPFRYGILSADDQQQSDLQIAQNGFTFDDNVLHQLQQMFSYLELSDRIDYNPQEFCAAFKDYAGQPVNIFIQQDAQEFLNMIFDKIENALKNTQYKHILNCVFGGKTCTQIQCMKCQTIKNRDEIFYNLSLPIKNLKHLQECFDIFVQGEVINDYYCEECNQKGDVNKRQLLAQLPNVLILHLQRIVFNLDTFMNEKINTRLEFPMELDLKNYLINQEQCSQYKLVGVVVHVGTADVGHYFSYIEINQGQWLEFNDHKIKEFKLKSMENECFGGQSNMDYYDSDVFGTGFRENSQSAYMLIYEKIQKDPIKLEFQNEQQLERIQNLYNNNTIIDNNQILIDYNCLLPYIPEEYKKKVNLDNQQFLFERNLFSSDLMKFIGDICQHVDENNAYLIIEVLLKFNYDLLAKAYDNSMMDQFGQQLLELVQKYPNEQYLEMIFQNKVIDLLLICPNSNTRKQYGKLLVTLFNQTIKLDQCINEKVKNYLDQLFLMIQDQVPKNWARFEQYFQFWLDFLKEGHYQIQYLLEKQMISYLIDFILDKSSPINLYEKKIQIGSAYSMINYSVHIQLINELLIVPEYTLSLQDKKLLYCPKFYDKLLKTSKIEELTQIVVRYAKDNRFYSEIIAGCILRGLGNNDVDEYKNYLQLFKPFILIQDNLKRERLEWLIGIPSGKSKETTKMHDNKGTDYPNFGLYGLSSLDEDYWAFPSPIGWQPSLFDHFTNNKAIKNYDVQCLLILKSLLQISIEDQECFNYISSFPCTNYLYKHEEEVFKSFLDIFILDTKKYYSQYPRKQESEETKILLDQYCTKLNEFRPSFDYIIGKTTEITKIHTRLYLYNPMTKEEMYVDEGTPEYPEIKQQIEEETLHKVILLEEKIFTAYICDNQPTGQTNESLPQQYVKGTQLFQYQVDPTCPAANFIQSKVWSLESEEKLGVSNLRQAKCIKQISLYNNTNRTLHVVLTIKGCSDCHFIPQSKIQSLMSPKTSNIMFTAVKTDPINDFPPLELKLIYKKLDTKQDSYVYISTQEEMNLESL